MNYEIRTFIVPFNRATLDVYKPDTDANLLSEMKIAYEGKCNMGSYIVEVTEIADRSMQRIFKNSILGMVSVSVMFKAKCLTLAQGDIVACAKGFSFTTELSVFSTDDMSIHVAPTETRTYGIKPESYVNMQVMSVIYPLGMKKARVFAKVYLGKKFELYSINREMGDELKDLAKTMLADLQVATTRVFESTKKEAAIAMSDCYRMDGTPADAVKKMKLLGFDLMELATLLDPVKLEANKKLLLFLVHPQLEKHTMTIFVKRIGRVDEFKRTVAILNDKYGIIRNKVTYWDAATRISQSFKAQVSMIEECVKVVDASEVKSSNSYWQKIRAAK